MVNQGAKKHKEKNAHHMAKLRHLIIACNVIYILVRMLIFHSSFAWKHWVGLLVTSAAYAIPYQQLAKMAQPNYADDGELLDGGFDMSTGGVCGEILVHIFGGMIHSSVIHIKWIWWHPPRWRYLIPAFGAYKSFGFVKGFLPTDSEDDTEDDKTRKKREDGEKSFKNQVCQDKN